MMRWCRWFLYSGLLGVLSCTQDIQSLTNNNSSAWHLVEMSIATTKDRDIYRHFTLSISPEKWSGSAINHFSIAAKLNRNNTVDIGENLMTTRMAVYGREQYLEKLYFTAIRQVNAWSVIHHQLILSGSNKTLVFEH